MKLDKTKFGYLGFLGLLSVLSLINYWLLAFLGFLALFALLKGDERIDRNVNQAGRNAFAYDTVIATANLSYLSLSKNYVAVPLFAVLLMEAVTVFGLSFAYYTTKGQ